MDDDSTHWIDPWTAHVPAMFRALADPAGRGAFPRPDARTLRDACATWGALHYALRSLLGWRRVGKGLAWWYRAGKPTASSPVLEFVRETWEDAGYLDDYAAWAWALHTDHLTISDNDALSPAWMADHSADWKDEDWWRAFKRRGRVHAHGPFYGGSDPLHLSVHDDPFAREPSAEAVHAVTERPRHVLLIAGGLDSWPADLKALEHRLPELEGRSWRVEVFDRQTGFLGLFRRSRDTGRWFTGKHSVHMQGQP